MAEWASGHDFAARVADLSDLAGSPGFLTRRNGDSFLLPGRTVFSDADQDTLLGLAGSDWLFGGAADQIMGLSAADRLVIPGSSTLDRLAGGYASELPRVWEELGIAEAQLRDYQARLPPGPGGEVWAARAGQTGPVGQVGWRQREGSDSCGSPVGRASGPLAGADYLRAKGEGVRPGPRPPPGTALPPCPSVCPWART
jgi:hypothetical protein